MNKILLIFGNYGSFGDYYLKKMNESVNVDVVEIDYLIQYIGLNNSDSFFIKRKKIVNYFNGYEKIISFTIRKDTIMYFLLSNNKRAFYFYVWNTIEKKDYTGWHLYFLMAFHKNVYTFDKGDSLKYNWGYNPQFYFKTELCENTPTIKNIAFFCGRNKGRFQILKSIARQLQKYEIERNIIVVEKENDISDELLNVTKKEMDYRSVLNCVKKSSIIIDIVKKEQQGMTARTLEAVFCNKKIITNNINIKNELFYQKDYIYVIENNDFDGFVEFLLNDNASYNRKEVEYYDFNNWIKRF